MVISLSQLNVPTQSKFHYARQPTNQDHNSSNPTYNLHLQTNIFYTMYANHPVFIIAFESPCKLHSFLLNTIINLVYADTMTTNISSNKYRELEMSVMGSWLWALSIESSANTQDKENESIEHLQNLKMMV